MSTILDALRRARSENAAGDYEGSRVFADPLPVDLRRRRAWVLPAVITTGLLVLLLLAGGSIYYVLRVMPQHDLAGMRFGATPTPTAAAVQAPTPAGGLSTPAPVSPAAASLPTPVPANQIRLDPVGLSTPPDAPEAGGKAAPPPFKLGTIVWNESQPLAIINNYSVREGDVRDDFTVIDITPHSVTIRTRDGSEIVLKDE